jgi:hypothetical protein
MAEVEQMKGEKQSKEVVGEECVVDTGTLDRYFLDNNKIKQLT